MPAPEPATRLATIDAVRGMAVLGILVPNIVAMGLTPYAGVDPHVQGGADGADLFAWGASYVLFEGKMRALFTMLFGASIILAAERAEAAGEGVAAPHFRRMAWLLLFGMLHAWLLWFGDILVQYAVLGCLVFVGRNWPARALFYVAGVMFVLALAGDFASWHGLGLLRSAAEAPGAPAMAREAWATVLATAEPDPGTLAREAALYRGGFADAFRARAPMTLMLQTETLLFFLPEAIGYAALGMALQRTGFFRGRCRRSTYWALVALGMLVALPLHAPIVTMLIETRFDPVRTAFADVASFCLRPWVAVAYASATILVVRSGRARGAVARLAAAGRMALSNYLGSTIVATTIFYGYGFGLYARLGRAELYIVVAAIWMLILLWSKPWLTRFEYGPFEWLWRSLASWRRIPLQRRSAIAT